MGWKKTNKRFVAFFDIMGFKDFIYRHNHNDVLELMNRLNSILQEINITEKDYEGKKIQTSIKSVFFSDSILMITNEDTKIDAALILLTATWFLAKCFEKEIPIKGCLSYGQQTADFENSIHFGQPLIDAFLLQEDLNFYGAILDDKFECFLKDNNLIMQDLLINYKAPLKSGKIFHHTLSWPCVIKNDYEQALKQIHSFYNTVSGKPRLNVDNTIEFINFLNRKD